MITLATCLSKKTPEYWASKRSQVIDFSFNKLAWNVHESGNGLHVFGQILEPVDRVFTIATAEFLKYQLSFLLDCAV